MTVARFKDLCMDAGDAVALAGFWQRLLGGTVVDQGDGSARLDPPAGRPNQEVVWIDPVPEPHTAKTRVHLDLALPGPDPGPLVRAGARLLREPDGDDYWWVLADPDGNEFCAFPPGTQALSRRGYGLAAGVIQLTLDCRDPQAQAAWWASVLGGEPYQEGYGTVLRGVPGFPWGAWLFQPVPEPKTVKNRVHWDVLLAEPVPDALVRSGARVLREPGGGIRWWVLADPEGNEFCAFSPAAA